MQKSKILISVFVLFLLLFGLFSYLPSSQDTKRWYNLSAFNDNGSSLTISFGDKKIRGSWSSLLHKSNIEHINHRQKFQYDFLEVAPQTFIRDVKKSWFYLSFPSLQNRHYEEDSGNFIVRSQNYIGGKYYLLKSEETLQGFDPYASFRGSHYINIAPKNEVLSPKWLLQDSFLLHLFVRPQARRNIMTILASEQIRHHRQGLRILYINGRIKLEVRGNKESDLNNNISIVSSDLLKSNEWNEIVVFYDRGDQDFHLFINGRHDRNVRIPLGKMPKFHTGIPVSFEIGKNFYGDLDEIFWIYQGSDKELFDGYLEQFSRAYSPYKKNRYSAITKNIEINTGILESPVIDLGEYGVILTNIKYKLQKTDSDQSIRLFFRMNRKLFSEEDGLPWQEWFGAGRTDIAKEGARFFQFKFILLNDFKNLKSPRLHSLNFAFDSKVKSSRPRDFQLEKKTSTLLLSWKRDPTSKDIAYDIFYGLEPNRAVGIIRLSGGKLIRENNFADGNRINVMVNNAIIRENMFRLQKIYPHLPFLSLQQNVPYYFWIRSYDLRESMTDKNILLYSKKSEILSVRM